MDDYRNEIYVKRIDRKALAREMGWSYTWLSQKLNGYSYVTPEDERRLRKAIDKLEGGQQ